MILTILVLFTAIHLIVLSMYTKFEDSSTYTCMLGWYDHNFTLNFLAYWPYILWQALRLHV